MQKNNFIALLIALLVGAALGYYYSPKPAAQTKEVEVTKTVTKIKTVKLPGKTVTETVIVNSGTRTKTDTKAATLWHLSAGAHTRFDRQPPQYEVSISRRFLGPIFLGLYGQTNGAVGARIGFEF